MNQALKIWKKNSRYNSTCGPVSGGELSGLADAKGENVSFCSQWLYEQGADVAIVGRMRESAQQLLREKGIEVIIGAPMDFHESLANQYLPNTLIAGDNICDY